MGHAALTTAERFWAKVNKSGPIPAHCPELGPCWVWTAALDRGGYGAFQEYGLTVKAHRYSFQLDNGVVASSVFVCHRCDNPACVRGTHLFAGDGRSNSADAKNKGRIPQGHVRAHSKLTADDVMFIREAPRSNPGYQQVLAIRFGVSQSVISRITTRKTWAHI